MQSDGGPDFSQEVVNNGYAWWYVDAISDDGDHGLTVIAFIGSVFSPYYARARSRGLGDPANHCAINVALYGKGGKRWALTERGRGALTRTNNDFCVGPSRMFWEGGDLVIDVDEITVPIPSRLKGKIRLSPSATTRRSFQLSQDGQHYWRPIAPFSRVHLDFQKPGLRWSGPGYFDWNTGETPLEDTFSGWDWARASSDKGTTIFYDGLRRCDGAFSLATAISKDGTVTDIAAPPPRAPLPTTSIWRIPRETRSDAGILPRVIETCEDTPFYARSMIETRIGGKATRAMHESLSLDRFDTRWVQTLLHFRMPRIAG